MLMTMVPNQPEWGSQSRNLRGDQRRGKSELQLPMEISDLRPVFLRISALFGLRLEWLQPNW